MRADMEDLIIDIGRAGSRDGRAIENGSRRSRQRIALASRDGDALPTCQRMRDVSYSYMKSQSDRLQPLIKWLKKQVGRPWDKVYSDFCDVTDARTLRGWHIKTHLDQLVDRTDQDELRFGQRFGLYVDEAGVLRDGGRRQWKRPVFTESNVKQVETNLWHVQTPVGLYEVTTRQRDRVTQDRWGRYVSWGIMSTEVGWPETLGEKPKIFERNNLGIIAKRQIS